MKPRLLRLIAAGLAAVQVARIVRSRRGSLAGKLAFITGGSRGLGLALAREYARRGCRVAVCARDAAELEATRDELARRGADVHTYVCDVTRPDEIRRTLDEVQARLGQVDILVNNAGIIDVGPLETMDRADFERAMATMFWGMLDCILAVLPGMRARGDGRIVNITSIGGKLAVPHILPYDAAKFAATGLSEGLHGELAREGIAVTTVVPGLLRTGGALNASFRGDPRREFTWFAGSDALPLLAVSPARAARRIVRASQLRRAEVTIGVTAKVARVVQGLFPGFTARALATANRLLLPPPGRTGAEAAGHELEVPFVRRLLDRSARGYQPPEPR